MQHDAIEIGPLGPGEADALGVLYFDAVHSEAGGHYTAEQCWAWAPEAPSGPDWATRLLSQWTIVARISGYPAGFMTLNEDGYIDLAFVAPGHQRKGIGQRLYSVIEKLARKNEITRLHTQASLLIKRFFEQRGWKVNFEQEVERSGVKLTNFVMEKHLGIHDLKDEQTGAGKQNRG